MDLQSRHKDTNKWLPTQYLVWGFNATAEAHGCKQEVLGARVRMLFSYAQKIRTTVHLVKAAVTGEENNYCSALWSRRVAKYHNIAESYKGSDLVLTLRLNARLYGLKRAKMSFVYSNLLLDNILSSIILPFTSLKWVFHLIYNQALSHCLSDVLGKKIILKLEYYDLKKTI